MGDISGRAILKRIDSYLQAREEGREALKIALDIPESTSSSWRTSRPRADDIYRIARYLGKTVEELVGGQEGLEYVRGLVAKEGKLWEPPEKIRDLVKILNDLDGIELKVVRKMLAGLSFYENLSSVLYDAYNSGPEYGPEPPAGREAEYNVIFIDKPVKEIPLLGFTAAGRPIDFEDLDPDPPTRPWEERFIRGDIMEYYCVGVRGTSMIMADIYDGDYVLLRRAEDFENGAIMLVRCEDSSTLKRIRIAEGPEGEEVSICWEDGSGQTVRLTGEGYEAQGKLVAVERTGAWTIKTGWRI